MTSDYANLKPVTSAGYLDLVMTKDAALLSASDYAAVYVDCKARWDGFTGGCQSYYQQFTNADLGKWSDRNSHIDHPEATVKQLDAWCASEIGQATLTRIGQACINWLNKNGDSGAPAHDRRHVMFKDVAEGRRFAEEDNIQGHNLCFFIGSLMHDSGRLLEERLSGTTLSGAAGDQHPYWSAEITAKLFDGEPDMPQEIKNDVLLSILAHQAGQTQWHFMSQAVQRGDRIGGLATPELFSRAIQFDVMELGMNLMTPDGSVQQGLIGVPGFPADDNLLSHVEFYTRFLFPNVGSKAAARAEAMLAINAAAIMIAAPMAEREIRFALEEGVIDTPASPAWIAALKPARIMAKAKLPEGIYAAACSLSFDNYAHTRPSEETDDVDNDLRIALAQAITRPGSTVSAAGVGRLGEKVDALTDSQKAGLLNAVTFIEQKRDALDAEDKAMLARASGIPFVDAISNGALAIASLPPTALPNPAGLFRTGPRRPGAVATKSNAPKI